MKAYVLILLVTAALMVAVALPQAVESEEVRPAYDISVRTYQQVSAARYEAIYRRVQDNSQRVMLDAARDACRAEGGDFVRSTFECRR